MNSVLITGGTSQIGSWITRGLIERGLKVVSYSRHPNTLPLRDLADKIDFVAGDILDMPTLMRTIKNHHVERVIHNAALLNRALEANPFVGYKVNVDGTMNVLEACRFMDMKRVVYISTKAVYDKARGQYDHPTYNPIDEEYPKVPQNVYGATKFFAENMVLNYHRLYGLDVLALRFATIYGPGKQPHHAFQPANRILWDFIEKAVAGEQPRVLQDVDQLDDMTYVKDIANSVILACLAENLEHRVFHIGTGKGETLRRVVEIVDNMFGRGSTEIVPVAEISSSGGNYVFNIERARRELGYTPQYNLEEGIKDYVQQLDVPDKRWET